jgi:UDP-N-acetylmuramate dehydrogenase
MILLENHSLKGCNTFGVDAKARYFADLSSPGELDEFLSWYHTNGGPLLILGGGSNILFSSDFEGTAVMIGLKGIRILEEKEDAVLVRAEAGEVWDDFVGYCVDHDYAGLENLSLIPGNVGSAPIQNIGAYGVDIKEVIHEVFCTEIATGKEIKLTNEECQLDYRESIFKRDLKGKVIITSVVFRLWKVNEAPGHQGNKATRQQGTKSPSHPVTQSPSRKVTRSPGDSVTPPYQLRLSYGNLLEELTRRGITSPTIKDVREIVCGIRRSKLPDPAVIGNAGSFFKNPRIETSRFESLKKEFPGIPGFPDECGIKVPAGWLIEQCGWKGKRTGNTGVHERQALVIVNHGNATGKEILDLASMVRQSVQQKFGIDLEIEVNVV